MDSGRHRNHTSNHVSYPLPNHLWQLMSPPIFPSLVEWIFFLWNVVWSLFLPGSVRQFVCLLLFCYYWDKRKYGARRRYWLIWHYHSLLYLPGFPLRENGRNSYVPIRDLWFHDLCRTFLLTVSRSLVWYLWCVCCLCWLWRHSHRKFPEIPVSPVGEQPMYIVLLIRHQRYNWWHKLCLLYIGRRKCCPNWKHSLKRVLK